MPATTAAFCGFPQSVETKAATVVNLKADHEVIHFLEIFEKNSLDFHSKKLSPPPIYQHDFIILPILCEEPKYDATNRVIL